jgi:hypothetical protein
MGTAGRASISAQSAQPHSQAASPINKTSTQLLAKAEDSLKRASEAFARVHDTARHCSALAKISRIARVRGDFRLAEDWAERYLGVWREGLEAGGV